MNLTLIDDLGTMDTPGNFYVYVLSINQKSYEILYWKPFDDRNDYEITVDPDLLALLDITSIISWDQYDEMASIINKTLQS